MRELMDSYHMSLFPPCNYENGMWGNTYYDTYQLPENENKRNFLHILVWIAYGYILFPLAPIMYSISFIALIIALLIKQENIWIHYLYYTVAFLIIILITAKQMDNTYKHKKVVICGFLSLVSGVIIWYLKHTIDYYKYAEYIALLSYTYFTSIVNCSTVLLL